MGRKSGKANSKEGDWKSAKHLCRLNQNDIQMAKALGFKPKTLIRNRPDPKQKWKLPVKYWIHDLHRERFGHVIGEAPDTGPVEDVSYMEEDDFPAFSDDDVPF